MTQPTHSREAIQSAHNLLDRFPGCTQFTFTKWELDIIRAVLPPIPEPERPKITPARSLACSAPWHATDHTIDRMLAIREARAEIIALLEWELDDCDKERICHCMGCNARHALIKELREADA